MGEFPTSDYDVVYLNPDGSWEVSGFKAHWGAEAFADFGRHLLPWEWVCPWA